MNETENQIQALVGQNGWLTAKKTASILRRDNSRVTGFVVTDPSGNIGIIDKSAVRWLSKSEMGWLMHESQSPITVGMSSDHSENSKMETNTQTDIAEPVAAMVVGSGPWLASVFAAKAHDGQKRRDGQTDYLMHPQAVAYKLRNEADEVVMTAWLHDVLEDTKETPVTMRASGIPERVIEAVRVLTKTEGVSYREYLERVKADDIARKVKVADMLHNLSDAPTDRQIVKYAKGLLVLANSKINAPSVP